MPLTSSVVNQLITNFKLYCCSKKFQMLQINVKSLLEQLKEIVFGVSCTLRTLNSQNIYCYFANDLPTRAETQPDLST